MIKKYKYQLILTALGVLLVIVFLFVPSIPPATGAKPAPMAEARVEAVNFEQIMAAIKKTLPERQVSFIEKEQNKLAGSKTKSDSLLIQKGLIKYFNDSIHNFLAEAYYLKNVALLDNSEKNLTFAAQLLVDSMMITNQPAVQNWLASNAKELFERSLELNSSNDSSKIGLASCYIFGNVDNNPMKGILPLREIVQRNPDNVYAQMVLGLGGRKSGQYDKAIERFTLIVTKHPDNLEAMINLAECYELKGDKENAIKWYETFKKKVTNPGIVTELENRINALKQ